MIGLHMLLKQCVSRSMKPTDCTCKGMYSGVGFLQLQTLRLSIIYAVSYMFTIFDRYEKT